MLLAVCIEELWFSLISLLIISCPPRHMGLGFVSHPLFLLLPPIMSDVRSRGFILMPLLFLLALLTRMGLVDTISMGVAVSGGIEDG